MTMQCISDRHSCYQNTKNFFLRLTISLVISNMYTFPAKLIFIVIDIICTLVISILPAFKVF